MGSIASQDRGRKDEGSASGPPSPPAALPANVRLRAAGLHGGGTRPAIAANFRAVVAAVVGVDGRHVVIVSLAASPPCGALRTSLFALNGAVENQGNTRTAVALAAVRACVVAIVSETAVAELGAHPGLAPQKVFAAENGGPPS